MFAVRSLRASRAVPSLVRAYAPGGEQAGATASSAGFEKRERSQEALFVRQRELEKLQKLREQALNDVKEHEAKIAELEKSTEQK